MIEERREQRSRSPIVQHHAVRNETDEGRFDSLDGVAQSVSLTHLTREDLSSQRQDAAIGLPDERYAVSLSALLEREGPKGLSKPRRLLSGSIDQPGDA